MQTRNQTKLLYAQKRTPEKKKAKRQRSPPSDIGGTSKRAAAVGTVIPGQANSETVCVVLRFHGQLDYQYDVCILPMGTRSLEPVMRLDKSFPAAMAFALSPGNKLFMFGGFNQNKEGKREWNSCAFRYELPKKSAVQSKTPCTVNLEMTQVPELMMMAPKISPAAVMVKNQICVFSTVLYRVYEHKKNSYNFELFDPDKTAWTVLREPLEDYSQFSETIKVEAHCVTSSSLFISTNRGIFVMDFNQSSLVWSRVEITLGSLSKSPTPTVLKRLPFLGSSIMIGNICFTPYHEYNIYKEDDASPSTSKGTTKKYRIRAPSSSPHYSQVHDEIVYANGPDNTKVPAFGDMALTHLGSNRLCRIKVGFKDTESTSKSNPIPYLIAETFQTKIPNKKIHVCELVDKTCRRVLLKEKICRMVSIKGVFLME